MAEEVHVTMGIEAPDFKIEPVLERESSLGLWIDRHAGIRLKQKNLLCLAYLLSLSPMFEKKSADHALSSLVCPLFRNNRILLKLPSKVTLKVA